MKRMIPLPGGLAVALLLSACNDNSSPASTAAIPPVTPPVTTVTPGAGDWTGSIDTPAAGSRDLRAIILDDGTVWITYTRSDSGSIAGILRGQGTLTGNHLDATGAQLLSLEDNATASTSVDLSVDIVPQSTLQGSLTRAGDVPALSLPTPAVFSATYAPAAGQPAGLANLAGSYGGTITTAAGTQAATVTISGDGQLAGTATAGCSLSGLAQPQPTGNIFTLNLQFGSEEACGANRDLTASGILSLTATGATALAMPPSGSNSFIFTGNR